MTNTTGQIGTPVFLAPELMMAASANTGNSVGVCSFRIALCCTCNRTPPYSEFCDMNSFQLMMIIIKDLRPTLPFLPDAHHAWLAGECRDPGEDVPDDPAITVKPNMVYQNQIHGIPFELLALIQLYWHQNMAKRPTFEDIAMELSKIADIPLLGESTNQSTRTRPTLQGGSGIAHLNTFSSSTCEGQF